MRDLDLRVSVLGEKKRKSGARKMETVAGRDVLISALADSRAPLSARVAASAALPCNR